MKNFAQFMVIRILLGIAEGGMMPGIAYYLSTFYKRDELALRMGIFGKFRRPEYLALQSNEGTLVSAASMAGAFSGILATGFLSVPQLQGL
jgi:MFS family permease